ncbi:hypothetical protein PRZ48_004232 [Zasmidium cellare]|uniref:Fe2OG dioxygenase domain-containing protein n=1 Tax=Zasmidium cellare TaxID=395010 RepID=A0ABR0EXA1_ZASCE|nr:hypothetical protein PRZ48_004232 [Zasmidium cellare]
MTAVPIADISAFVGEKNNERERKEAAKQLADAVKVNGCAGITGHGLPEADLGEAFSTMRKLFGLPLDDKMKAPHPDGPRPHRGYLATAKEKSGKLGAVWSTSKSEKEFFAKAIDWKETYDIGHEDNRDQPNVWLPDDILPGFRPQMVKLYDQLTAVAEAILEGLMLGMDLTEDECKTLRQMHSPIEHQIRLAHYLPMNYDDLNDPNKIRLASHRDFSSYTLLFQESESGLEFQNRANGEYLPASPREGVMYLNIGELMERFSNGKPKGLYPSAMHRVAIRPTKDGEKTVPGRFSLPFFTKIKPAEPIYPLPSRVEADGKANYEPVGFQDLAKKLFSTLLPTDSPKE